MSDRRTFFLRNADIRHRAADFCFKAPDGYAVQFKPQTRTLDQNSKFHAICQDLERSCFRWAGKPRSAEQWKVLLVSGHAVATKEGSEMVPGLESEFVNMRESTASMSKARSASLIEYALAFCAQNGVQLKHSEDI